MVELNLKVKIPENHLKAAQELIDMKKWTDRDLEQALNFILFQGLNVNLSNVAIEDILGVQNARAFAEKHSIRELEPEDIERILQTDLES